MAGTWRFYDDLTPANVRCSCQDLFGHWPNFHDAEIITLRLEASELIVVKLTRHAREDEDTLTDLLIFVKRLVPSVPAAVSASAEAPVSRELVAEAAPQAR